MNRFKKLYFFAFLIFSFNSFSQEKINYHHALNVKSGLGFKNSYRVLKTTFKSLDGFQKKYPGTKVSLEKILRFYLNTSIYLCQNENLLISLDSTKFILINVKSEEEITKEVVSLIGNMQFGLDEVKSIPFTKKNYRRKGMTAPKSN